MSRFLASTRYLVLLPIAGLALAAAIFFVFGGAGLIRVIVELVVDAVTQDEAVLSHAGELPVQVVIVEYVHTLLIGTVLYITAIGLYQLFIGGIDFPRWLQIDSTDELETNLIGVTVVVLAVQFMGLVFTRDADELLRFGAGIALPIAALGIFVGLRTWSTSIEKRGQQEGAAPRPEKEEE
jgi:uncharacterized membrane protein YqhA